MRHVFHAAAFGVAMVMAPGATQAAVTITGQQVGPNVVFTLSGSINTTGLAAKSTLGFLVGFNADYAVYSATGGTTQLFTGITGPTSYGPFDPAGQFQIASSSSGSTFYLNGSGFGVGDIPVIGLASGYVSGSALSATTTFLSRTLDQVGATPGTYVYNLPNDTVTLIIGSGPPVPEPASWAMMIAGLSLVGASLRRRSIAVRFA